MTIEAVGHDVAGVYLHLLVNLPKDDIMPACGTYEISIEDSAQFVLGE